MRYFNENNEEISEDSVDLDNGRLFPITVIREDAAQIDNITKFAWSDDDYEEAYLYLLNPKFERTDQDDVDSMLIDMEFRITLLELGL